MARDYCGMERPQYKMGLLEGDTEAPAHCQFPDLYVF